MENRELKINGERIEFAIEVDVYDGGWPSRYVFNGKAIKSRTFIPVLLIEASTLRQMLARDSTADAQMQ